MKKNGYVLYETLISLTFCFIIILAMFNMILSLSNKLNDIYIMNKIESNIEILQKQIYDDIKLEPCIFSKDPTTNTINIQYSGSLNKTISISNNAENDMKELSYGDYIFEFNDMVNIELGNIIDSKYDDTNGINSFNIIVTYKEKEYLMDIYYMY